MKDSPVKIFCLRHCFRDCTRKFKTSHVLVRELHYVDSGALVAHLEAHLQNVSDRFA